MQVPLWRQLQVTAAVVQEVSEGRSATAALDGVDAALRPGVRALSYAVLRQLGRAQALRGQLARRRPPPAADSLLCSALALASDVEASGHDLFTLVNQTVEAAKRSEGTVRQADFINACLRRYLRERESLTARVNDDPCARWNHPTWWVRRLQRDHPDAWERILQADGERAPMTLRVNMKRSTPSSYLDVLRESGIAACAAGPFAVQLERPRPTQDLPGFAQGWVSVQDAAAQLAAPLLLDGLVGAEGPPRVLDACAAPGGKTGHLLEYSDCQVTAIDIDGERCQRIDENLNRLGLQAYVMVADASEPDRWWPTLGSVPFDAILLDAPCTASGIVRRHPDVRWLRRESDVDQLGAIQQRLLQALWPLLRTGGRMLYCTCSVFLAEGEQQVQSFVANNNDARLRPAPGHLLPQSAAGIDSVRDNPMGNHDGFFYALLEKSPP